MKTEMLNFENLKVGDSVTFIKKSDKKDIIKAAIIDINENKVGFIDLMHPVIGRCSFLKDSLSKYYTISY